MYTYSHAKVFANHHINSKNIAPQKMQPPISPREPRSLDKPGKPPNPNPRYWQNHNPADQQPISVHQRSLAVSVLPLPHQLPAILAKRRTR